ncbi:MAG: ABC transporter ATP-binding protein [Candidatus Poribacteria bacterium]|nr:MAG: ABC transporter ATP-binding protein [Candidatus Poribacteria bacterium]
MREPVVQLQALTKVYREGPRDRVVLNGVNWTFYRGEWAVLLGRSGSGKSTLLNLIGGLDLPTSGEVMIRGRSLSRMSERERTLFRRREVGFIFQFFNLIPTLTVEENLLLPMELNGVPVREGKARVTALLERVGLRDRRDAYPDRLSGGEQQRVAAIRAFVHRPALVLADEPTGNLDAKTAAEVLELMREIHQQQGATLLVATHDPQIAAMADRVLTIEDGKLHELVSRPVER